MKKYLLFIALALMISIFASGASVTIINSGFTFSPNSVTINIGDTVKFQLASIHNALEVSETTWNANGNTPLPGGFNTPFGNSELTGLSAGVHYFVCSNHYAMGMKGKITVNSTSGNADNKVETRKFNIFPNPTKGKFTLQFNGPDGTAGSWTGSDPHTGIEIFNILGEKIADLSGLTSSSSNEIDLTSVPDGIYFIRLKDSKSTYTEKLIKR